MTERPCIAVDAMGGDEGLAVMLAGVARARRRFPDELHFLLVGDETAIRAELESHPNLSAHSEVIHAPEVVGSSDKPSQAMPIDVFLARRMAWQSTW